MLKKTIQLAIEEALNIRILNDQSVSGGCINDARTLTTSKGTFFLKQNTKAALLAAEVVGLRTLADVQVLRVPKVIWFQTIQKTTVLVLEYIEPGTRSTTFWEAFGIGLAKLHRITAPTFGFSSDNFIGALPQSNNQHTDWATFYWRERIQPQLQLALQSGHLEYTDEKIFNRIYSQLDTYFPEEPPSLTHGDLWSGNFLCDQQSTPVLIDPAVSYTHRELDIAMTHLFGGFDRQFYEAYEATFPLALNFQERLPLYQLYYLLAHVNLFGGSYVASVRRILRSF